MNVSLHHLGSSLPRRILAFPCLSLPSRSYHARQQRAKINHYEILGVLPDASLKEIKTKFKKLSLKHHPDVNNSMLETDADKEANNNKYIQILGSYEILKDDKKRSAYDSKHRQVMSSEARNRKQEQMNKYYGEAKYYSRSASARPSPSGLNNRRTKVHWGAGTPYRDKSFFHGRYQDFSTMDDTPHFNYAEYLKKQSKIEMRLCNSRMEKVREEIRSQLVEASSTKLPISEHIRIFEQKLKASQDDQKKPESYNEHLDQMIKNAEKERQEHKLGVMKHLGRVGIVTLSGVLVILVCVAMA